MADPKAIDKDGVLQRGYAEDKHAVDEFAGVMLDKLRENRHKAHWKHVDRQWLMDRMMDEIYELNEAIADDDPLSISLECADVANFAMMIADNEARNDGVY
jgi:NTP pyrophosphatase (non-canonical NTP hydrolase)